MLIWDRATCLSYGRQGFLGYMFRQLLLLQFHLGMLGLQKIHTWPIKYLLLILEVCGSQVDGASPSQCWRGWKFLQWGQRCPTVQLNPEPADGWAPQLCQKHWGPERSSHWAPGGHEECPSPGRCYETPERRQKIYIYLLNENDNDNDKWQWKCYI